MNTNRLEVLFSFVLGVVVTVFFIHIYTNADVLSTKVSSSPFGANIVDSVTVPSLAAITSKAVASSSIPTEDAPVIKRYEYKFLRDVDPCTMNKLGGEGWLAFQFGTNLEQAYGYDDNCKKGKVYDVIEWTLFSREK